MEKTLSLISRTFTLNLGKFQIEPTIWQAVTIVFLIFLLLLTLARVRYLYVNWSLGQSAIAMLFWGFLLAIIFEGFLLISGRTLLTEVLGWQNAPKPVSTLLEVGRGRLINVLGKSTTWQAVVEDYRSLNIEDANEAVNIICKQ